MRFLQTNFWYVYIRTKIKFEIYHFKTAKRATHGCKSINQRHTAPILILIG